MEGESGETRLCGRESWIGFSTEVGANEREFSKASGRSYAPGGAVLLLGLPCGVWAGLMKPLLAFLVGVEGRAESRAALSLPDWKKLDMKLVIVAVGDDTTKPSRKSTNKVTRIAKDRMRAFA